MTSTKRQAYIETAADLLQKVHTDLLHNRRFNEAAQVQEIIRRIVLFSDKKKREKRGIGPQIELTENGEGLPPTTKEV